MCKHHKNQNTKQPIGLVNCHNVLTDMIFPVIGCILFISIIPLLASQIGVSVIWGRLLHPAWLKVPHLRFTSRLVSSALDTDFSGRVIWMGFIQPYIWYCIYNTYSDWWITIAANNILHIGPLYINFAHAYTICHMEAHQKYKLFLNSSRHPFAYIFNGWIGLWYGVLPGTFTHSHIHNHHRYNNSISDLYSTAGYPRDSIWNWMRYLVVWFLYATNISTVYDFWQRGMAKHLCSVLIGTFYYIAFVYSCCMITSTWYILWTVVWAFVEGNALLSVVNLVWHMFLDENGDEFVGSTTIVNGTEFIFSEEYHAVHHKYPGIHHSQYKSAYQQDCDKNKYSIVFENVNIFELGFTAMLRDYEHLKSMVKDPKPDTVETLKRRLRCTFW